MTKISEEVLLCGRYFMGYGDRCSKGSSWKSHEIITNFKPVDMMHTYFIYLSFRFLCIYQSLLFLIFWRMCSGSERKSSCHSFNSETFFLFHLNNLISTYCASLATMFDFSRGEGLKKEVFHWFSKSNMIWLQNNNWFSKGVVAYAGVKVKIPRDKREVTPMKIKGSLYLLSKSTALRPGQKYNIP